MNIGVSRNDQHIWLEIIVSTGRSLFTVRSGAHFRIKTILPGPHYKEKMVMIPCYFYYRNSYTGRRHLYTKMTPTIYISSFCLIAAKVLSNPFVFARSTWRPPIIWCLAFDRCSATLTLSPKDVHCDLDLFVLEDLLDHICHFRPLQPIQTAAYLGHG